MSPMVGPHRALRRLQPLVGTWTLAGRTLGSEADDIKGRVVIDWLPDGFYLEQRGEIEIPAAGRRVRSLEVVGYDPESDTFPSQAYTNLGGEPEAYAWDVRGNVVTHWTKGSRYTGRLSEDGRTLSGGWRAAARGTDPGSSFDAVLTRIK
jgi:hypothetical protein